MDNRLVRISLWLVALCVVVVALMFWWGLFGSPQQRYRFATGSDLGLYHRLATELERVIERSHPDIAIEIVTTAGSNENVEKIDAGDSHFGLVQNDAQGGQEIRSIAAIYPEVLHLVCRNSSGIGSLSDLSGKSIGVGLSGSGTEQVTIKLLDFAGVGSGNSDLQRVSFRDSIEALRFGEMDAAFFLTGLGSDVISSALDVDDVSIVPLVVPTHPNERPEDTAKKLTDGFRVSYPHVHPATVPIFAYGQHPENPIPTLSVQAVLACGEDIDSDVVQRVTQTIFEKRAVLSQQHPAFSNLDEQAAQANLQFPLHAGAEHYYRRREPGFLAENAESMGFILTLLLIGWSALVGGKRLYAQYRKNRIDKYYKQINELMQQVRGARVVDDLVEVEAALVDIRERAASELIDEKLAADDAYLIFQNMLRTCQDMLLRRRGELDVVG